MYSLWGILAAAALLWPDRISGPLDGVPLDRVTEAILIAGMLPALWYFHPRFLRSTLARASIVLLIAWKIGAAALFVQDGWCVRFQPARPFALDAKGAPHAWDLRADWRSPSPACSAIMTRSYHDLNEFPAWFFNLPPDSESWPAAADRPPGATVGITVRGFLHAREAGYLRIELARDVTARLYVDGAASAPEALIGPGTHAILINGTLTGDQWRLVPTWNGADLWSSPAAATTSRPSRVDLIARPAIRWVPTLLALGFLLAWFAAAVARIGDRWVVAWTTGGSTAIALLVLADRADLARLAIAGLGAAVLVPVRPRWRNLGGAFLMIGVPWITFVVACAATAIGRFVIYGSGHDFWMYQRFAYRIVMQGYVLEWGSQLFYFQPFYRWIVGLLHVVFGDSSAGEWFWDGACLLAGALLSFRIARTFAGFRWGLAAAVLTLAVFAIGPAHYLIGYGLGEISSAGLLSMAALCVLRSRHRGASAAVVAGLLATFAFYTRLNNLIMAAGVALFALPLNVPARALLRPALWWRRVAWRTVVIVPAVIAFGLAFLAWRNWHYSGVFDPFYGTQRYVVAIWQTGMPIGTVLQRLTHSVMLVLTVNDPPRFDVYALPILAGAAVAGLSLAGTPGLRDLPAAAVLFFFASIAGAFVAAGWTYTGRFSIHVMPITCALTACGLARVSGTARTDLPPDGYA